MGLLVGFLFLGGAITQRAQNWMDGWMAYPFRPDPISYPSPSFLACLSHQIGLSRSNKQRSGYTNNQQPEIQWDMGWKR
jgi:hypothetical protein